MEIGGKLTILGAFADGKIIFAKGTKFPVSTPIAVTALFADGVGEYDVTVQISDPTNQVLTNFDMGKAKKDASSSLSIIVNIPSFVVPGPGMYSVYVQLDNQQYVEHFTVGVQ